LLNAVSDITLADKACGK